MYSNLKLFHMIEEKKAEKDSLEQQITEYEKVIYSANNAEEVPDVTFIEIEKCKTKVKLLNSLIQNANEQVKILQGLEKSIKTMEKNHTDIFKSAYRLLNTKL